MIEATGEVLQSSRTAVQQSVKGKRRIACAAGIAKSARQSKACTGGGGAGLSRTNRCVRPAMPLSRRNAGGALFASLGSDLPGTKERVYR
jgi:hypothetical protein